MLVGVLAVIAESDGDDAVRATIDDFDREFDGLRDDGIAGWYRYIICVNRQSA